MFFVKINSLQKQEFVKLLLFLYNKSGNSA